MNPLNKLETALFKYTLEALSAYKKMTSIGRPFHVPESFVQMFIALRTSKALDRLVLPEATKKKIEEIADRSAKGVMPSNSKNRYDLIAFFGNGQPWAVVELKKANALAPLVSDKKKVCKFLSGATGKLVRRGYLLVFTGAKPKALTATSIEGAREKVDKRFEAWKEGLDAALVSKDVTYYEASERVVVGVALYRIKKSSYK